MSRPTPVRLMPAALPAPTPLLGALPHLPAAPTPAWLGAKPGPLRPLVSPPQPEPEVVAAPEPLEPAAPVIDEAAVEQVLSEARAAGLAEGERAGIAAGQAKVDAIIERYADGIAHLASATSARSADDAAAVVDLALVVARELVGHELSHDRTFLVTMLTEALATVGARTPVRLRIGSTDLAYLQAVRPEVLTPEIEVVEDEALGVGGCVVEAEHAVVDATVEGRLAAVGAALRDALASGALGGPSEPAEAPRASADAAGLARTSASAPQGVRSVPAARGSTPAARVGPSTAPGGHS